ncbi:MAG TPA: hypothetical protein VGB00_14185 [Pyrinomonadaceae bacterium]|jgi:hypothetical protein
MKYLSVAFVLFLTINFAFAQKSEYTIRARNERLIVKHQGKAHALALGGEQIDAAKITSAEILFASRKDDFLYLLVDVAGQSRAKQNDRQCGAGTESNLIWIKLDAAWQTVESGSERYESCWSGVTSGDGYKINGNLLTVEFDNFREDVTVKLSYNADAPETGFQKKSSALNNQ